MATVDISRGAGRHKKRDISVAAYYLSESEVAKLVAAGEAAATDTFSLGKLPTNILITASTVTVLVPFTVAATINVGITGGAGNEFGAAVPLDAVTDTVVAGSGDISIQTGPVTQVVFAGAGLAVQGGGYALVTVEYIEHSQCTGELTNFVS